MNQSISIKQPQSRLTRISQLFSYDWAIARKNLLTLLIVSITIPYSNLITDLIFNRPKNFTDYITENSDIFRFIVTVVLLFGVYSIVLMSQKFNKKHTPHYIQLPATAVEKYVVSFIEVISLGVASIIVAHLSWSISLLLGDASEIILKYLYTYDNKSDIVMYETTAKDALYFLWAALLAPITTISTLLFSTIYTKKVFMAFLSIALIAFTFTIISIESIELLEYLGYNWGNNNLLPMLIIWTLFTVGIIYLGIRSIKHKKIA